MKLRKLLLVPGMIGMILSHGSAYGASTGGMSQLSTKEIYRRGYLAGYRAAYRKYRGESRSSNLPSGNEPMSISTQLIAEDAMTGGAVSVLRVIPKYQLNEKVSIGAQLGIMTAFANENDSDNGTTAEDGKLIFKHSGAQLNKIAKASMTLEVVLPISEKSREQKTLITGLTPIPRLDLDFSSLGAKGLSSYVRLAGTRNYHTSEMSHSASPTMNTRYSLIPKGGIAYSIADPVGVEVGFAREFHWTYDNSQIDKYELYQEIGFTVSKSVSLALGHYTANSITNTTGIELASKQASNVYGVMSVTF